MSDRRRARRTGKVRSAAELVESVLARHGVAEELREHRLVTQWPDIVGERVAARSWPDSLKDGVLYVRVSNSSWLHELSFLRKDFTRRANEVCGARVVKDVRFHLGEMRHPEDEDDVVAALSRRKDRRPVPRPRPAPTDETLLRIDQETEQISDPELREAIRQARRRLGV